MNIPVTKPFLPPAETYLNYVKGVWERNWLTNNGPLVNELELQLKRYLGLDHLLFLSNGTVALQIAIRALELEGEIITTPFSYVATTSSIMWENCRPVMADIDPDTLNIASARIEEKITANTSAILATHVFGNPCDVLAIEKIAIRRGLKVIYDAAHGFGTVFHGKSLLEYGDISTCSFHATKLFHTVEGGAVVTQDAGLLKALAELRNFGHVSATEFGRVGINAKNSELHAAMGLCNIPYVPEILDRRKFLYHRYKDHLQHTSLQFQKIMPGTIYNHSYFPVIFDSESEMLRVTATLNLHNIFPRRYFFPSLSNLPYVQGQHTPI
ncbi:MAG: DegT/DnrJ/EryC1/StrS family aminotransferase, partial [Cytophagaceae bacterium]